MIGIGGTAVAVGECFFLLRQTVLEKLGSCALIFVVAGSVYLLAMPIIHLLVPRMEEAKAGDA